MAYGKQIVALLAKANLLAEQRKALLDRLWANLDGNKDGPTREIIDRLWVLENEAEKLRTKLMELVGDELNLP